MLDTDELTPALGPAKAPYHPPLAPLNLAISGPTHSAAYGSLGMHPPLSPNGKDAARTLFVLSSTWPVRPPFATPAPKRARIDDEDHTASKRVRSSRCGNCTNCSRRDCGKCINCADKPKFGGPGVKKQGCMERKCLWPNRVNGHDAASVDSHGAHIDTHIDVDDEGTDHR